MYEIKKYHFHSSHFEVYLLCFNLLLLISVTEADWKFEPCLAREGSSGPDWQNILSNQALYV